MVQKFKTAILSLSTLLMLAVPIAVPAMASAQNINKQLKCGSNIDLTTPTSAADECNDATTDKGLSLTELATKIINILSAIVGAIAVIMIIIGGFRYVTSGGSDSNVGSAKKTILYALIGLVIVALAQIIVHFVLNNIGTPSGG